MAPTSEFEDFTRVRSAQDIGALVRANRKAHGDLRAIAGLVGVGTRFLGDLERGKPTVRLGLVLQVLERLGLDIYVAPRNRKPSRARR